MSCDTPAATSTFQRDLEDEGGPLGFPLACDPERHAVKAYGVYDAEHNIALPSILILDRQGRVAWSYIGETMLDRPGEDDVVTVLKRLRAERR